MIPQELIEGHANRIAELSLRFEEKVSREMDAVIVATADTLLTTLSTRRGVVKQTPNNAKKILAVEVAFKFALEKSEYYPAVLALVSSFREQVDEFESMHGETNLVGEDRQMLVNQAAAAVATFEAFPMKVTFELRQLLGRSLGESNSIELVKGISEVIRKMTKVGPIAKDQLLIFFRSIGSLTYKKIEDSGVPLRYEYVGPGGKNHRDFCKKLLDSSPRTREEIVAMDNGQMPGIFENCGGFGCSHWWAAC